MNEKFGSRLFGERRPTFHEGIKKVVMMNFDMLTKIFIAERNLNKYIFNQEIDTDVAGEGPSCNGLVDGGLEQ